MIEVGWRNEIWDMWVIVVEGMEEVVLSVDGKMVGCEGERKKLEV